MFFRRLASRDQGHETLVFCCSELEKAAVRRLLPSTATARLVRSPAATFPSFEEASPAFRAWFGRHAAQASEVVFCGHVGCQALRDLLIPSDLHPPASREWSRKGSRVRAILGQHYLHLDAEALVDVALQEHLLLQVERLQAYPGLQRRLDGGSLQVRLWIWEEEAGRVHRYDPISHRFLPGTRIQLPSPAEGISG